MAEMVALDLKNKVAAGFQLNPAATLFFFQIRECSKLPHHRGYFEHQLFVIAVRSNILIGASLNALKV